MKTIRYILISLVVWAVAACADDWDRGAQTAIRITAGIQPSTRTVFSENNGVTYVGWTAGDEIGLYAPTQQNLKYVADADGTFTSLTAAGTQLTAEEGDEVFAYYPYQSGAQNGTFSLGEQSSDRSPVDFDYLYATNTLKDNALELRFHHVFAFLKVTVKRADIDAGSVRPNVAVAGTNALWAGAMSVVNNSLQPTDLSSIAVYYLNEAGTSDEVSFYMALLPQEGGVSLKIGSMTQSGGSSVFGELYEKTTPADGLQAGNVYEVSISEDIAWLQPADDLERDALVALYQATDGGNWSQNTNWCTDQPLPEWTGVSLTNGHVSRLFLYNNGLSGSLPDVFGNLPLLTDIDFRYNQLSGTLPASLTQGGNWGNQWVKIVAGNDFDMTDVPLPAPVFTAVDIDGNIVTSDLFVKNKLTMVLEWASWCTYSKALIPQLVSLYNKYHAKGFEIIGCSTTCEYTSPCDTEADVRACLEEMGITWINVLDNGSNSIGGLSSLATPTVYLINSDRNVVYQTVTGDSCSDALQYVIDYFGEVLSPDEGGHTSSDYSRDGEVFTIQAAAVGKGIDLVFMGDGFVDTDMEPGGAYEQKMAEAVENFFVREPYKSFRNRFNCYGVKVVSANAEWLESTMNHAINEDMEVAYAYAMKAVGDIEYPIRVIVTYNADWFTGRSYTTFDSLGDFVSFVMEPTADDRDVLTHEACGHGFANLLDEYVENESDLNSPSTAKKNTYDSQWKNYGWGANVDWRNSLTEVRWAKFIADSRYAGEDLGAYEGAATWTRGMYRPTENSMMRYNDTPFNAPSREQIYKRIMQCSEGDSWTYDYETFVEYDAINRNAVQSRAVTYQPTRTVREIHRRRHRAPVYVEGSLWKQPKVNNKRSYRGPLR